MRKRNRKIAIQHHLKFLTSSPKRYKSKKSLIESNLKPSTTVIDFEENKYKERYQKSIFLTPEFKHKKIQNGHQKNLLRGTHFQSDIMTKIYKKNKNFSIRKSNSFYDPLGQGFYKNPRKIDKNFLENFKQEYSKTKRYRGKSNNFGILPMKRALIPMKKNSWKKGKSLDTERRSKKIKESSSKSPLKDNRRRRNGLEKKLKLRGSISIIQSIDMVKKEKESRIAFKRDRVREAIDGMEEEKSKIFLGELWKNRRKLKRKIESRLPVFKYQDYRNLSKSKTKKKNKRKGRLRTIDMLNREDIKELILRFKKQKKNFTSFDLEKFLVDNGIVDVLKNDLRKRQKTLVFLGD